MCQALDLLDSAAMYEFWEVCRLYENEGWWREINSSSLPAIPVIGENATSLNRSLVPIAWLGIPRYPDSVAGIYRGARYPRAVQADSGFLSP